MIGLKESIEAQTKKQNLGQESIIINVTYVDN